MKALNAPQVEFHEENVDIKAVDAKIEKIGELRTKVHKICIHAKLDVSKVLTSNQLEKLKGIREKMNGYERMMTAVRGGQPDRVPIWELIINRPVIEALYPEIFKGAKKAAYERGSQGSFLLQADFVEMENLDGITVFEDSRVREWIDSSTFVDEWDITWKINPHNIPYAVNHPIETEQDLDRWEPPDPEADYRLESLELAVKRFKGEKAIVFLGHDAFEFSHYLRGMGNLLMDYSLNPNFVNRIARKVIQYKTRVLEQAVEMGADILATGDDYAHRYGPIMSPEHFKEFVLPYLRQCVDIAKRNGLPFLKHTDGNLWKIMDSLIGTGIDCLNPLEPLANMDIGLVRKRYGNRIALAGNVDCGQLLPHASREEVVEAVKETLAKGAVDGSFILASSNSIHPAVNPQNYKAMVEAGRKFGQYPLGEKMVQEYNRKDYMAQYR